MTDELLSQAEIDQLISALRSGQVAPESTTPQEERRIRPYDFRRPDRFSKDQLRTVSVLHGAFARMAGMALSVHLRSPIAVSVRSVEQLSYEEFVRSIPSPTVIVLFRLEPLEGRALLEFSNSLALAMVDRLLGGPGRADQPLRPLTELERGLVERLMQRLLPLLHDAWQSVADVRPVLLGLETNPQFAHIAGPTDVVLLVYFQVDTSHQSYRMNLCLPYLLLQPILSLLSATTLFRAPSRSVQTELLQRAVEDTHVPVQVELGRAWVPLGDLLSLGPNDVIRLDRRAHDPLEVLVEGIPVFSARPGRMGGRLAVQILAQEASSRHG
ncbi:MAG: flagellar motor switch protein FliM [Armatimonadetes bacterium]|nr:flagellar motor switch protein FliM [Armatimonadota bacterium]MDW8152856.1 flagellar motor switch protein FliM [Armatimonadota bacterium]